MESERQKKTWSCDTIWKRNADLKNTGVKEWCWSWNSSTLATSWDELTHWKRPWCWEGLWTGGEGDLRGWDRWMASPTCWTWVWVNSASWWWTGRPGMLRFMGSQRVRHDWVTELDWTELIPPTSVPCLFYYEYWNLFCWGQYILFKIRISRISYSFFLLLALDYWRLT